MDVRHTCCVVAVILLLNTSVSAQSTAQLSAHDENVSEKVINPIAIFLYWSDDGDLMALRVKEWKLHFMEQRSRGLSVWQEPLVTLRLPKLYNLRSGPFERADQDATLYYDKWFADRIGFLVIPAQAIVSEFLKTFEEFPPRQRPASFSIDQALEKAREKQKVISAAAGGPAN
jgi:hypothetical protein